MINNLMTSMYSVVVSKTDEEVNRVIEKKSKKSRKSKKAAKANTAVMKDAETGRLLGWMGLN